MTRTDIHRPAAIVPADYNFVAVRYLGEGVFTHANLLANARILDQHMERTGGHYSRHQHGGTCHVCGAGALYLAVYHHPKTNTYICVGEDCADKIDLGETEAFAPVRRAVKDAKEYAAGKAKAERLLTERGLEAALTIDHDIIKELVRKLQQYGNLSDKQWAFLERLVIEFPKRQELMAERAKENAKSEFLGHVGMRSNFTATVVFHKPTTTVYGISHFHVLKSGDDVLIYSGNKCLGNKGETVTFNAAVKAHQMRDGVKNTVVTRVRKL